MRTNLGLLLLLSTSAAVAGCASAPAPDVVNGTGETPIASSNATVAPAPQPTAGAVFARYKEASGGAAWDRPQTLEEHGTMSTGGLSGPLTVTQDDRGRSVDHYELGPMRGADGFDGTHAWRSDPGGEVAALDAPEARAIARTNAWLASTAMFQADLGGAVASAPQRRDEAGHGWDVIEVTPTGGKPATLWFDASTGLLGKTVTRQGGNTVTTVSDDYRRVGDRLVPFHAITDSTDPAGRTDPRDRVEVRFERVAAIAAPADSLFAMPAMSAVARIADPSGVARVPFELINNHIYAAGSVNGKRARFLVDTGGVNIVSPRAAKRFGVTAVGKLATHGVGDEAPDLGLANADEIRLGGAILAKPVLYVTDALDFGSLEGTEADGVVGYEIFRRFRVTVDYAKHMLTLTDPAKFQPPAGAHVVPFEQADRIPTIEGTLDGMPVRLSVDTGSRSSLTLNSPFVKEHDLINRYHPAPESISGWGAGGPHRAQEARTGTLVLGDLAVKDVATELSSGTKGAFASDAESGNLGGGVLKRFAVTFDYDAKKMYLVPNATAGKPDDYDRSGMWINQAQGGLRIEDVVPDGPAKSAGLSVGDEIVSIDGVPTKRRRLYDWRIALRELPAGKSLALVVRTGSVERRTSLVLADQIPLHAPSR